MADYKIYLSFQNLSSHVKFYRKQTGLKTPDIIINDDDWDERCDTKAWIGCRQDEATNKNKDFQIENEYVHHVFNDKTIYFCMK